MYRFEGSRILIAGGSSGIGLETARLLASLGGEIIIASRNREKLDRALAGISGNVSAVILDAEDETDCINVMKETGSIDHLILTLSGGKGGGTFQSLKTDDLREAFNAKFWAHFTLARQSLPYINKNGSITFVTAISSRASNPGTSGLSAVNSAIEGLIKPLAVELAPLRINAVSPGVIDTPWWDMYDGQTKENLFRQFSSQTPAGRIGRPEDIAEAVTFLTGNTFMTGTVIECDGGLHLISSRL